MAHKYSVTEKTQITLTFWQKVIWGVLSNRRSLSKLFFLSPDEKQTSYSSAQAVSAKLLKPSKMIKLFFFSYRMKPVSAASSFHLYIQVTYNDFLCFSVWHIVKCWYKC